MEQSQSVDSETYTIATLGFEQAERRVLRQVLFISENRTPDFKPYEKSPGKYPHIVIVNGDRDHAVRQWRKFRQSLAGKATVSEVILSREPHDSAPRYAVLRPFHSTRLFALLERAVTEEHGFAAPLGIDLDESLIYMPGDDAPWHAGDDAANSDESRDPSSAPVADVRALVVDDSLPVRVQLKFALERLASHVDFAETGEEALELIDRATYDVILLDVILPGKDGYEICREIKKHPLQQSTPVLMLTGNSSPVDRVKGKLAGCDTYLIKPIGQVVFEQVIRQYVGSAAT